MPNQFPQYQRQKSKNFYQILNRMVTEVRIVAKRQYRTWSDRYQSVFAEPYQTTADIRSEQTTGYSQMRLWVLAWHKCLSKNSIRTSLPYVDFLPTTNNLNVSVLNGAIVVQIQFTVHSMILLFFFSEKKALYLIFVFVFFIKIPLFSWKLDLSFNTNVQQNIVT